MKHLLLLLPILLFSCSKKEKSYEQYAPSGLTTRTEALLHNLPRLSEKGTLIGQEFATLAGVGWLGDSARSDIKSVCGDHPAASGYYIRYESRDIFTDDDIRLDILETVRRGSLAVFSVSATDSIDRIAAFLGSVQDGYGKYAPVLVAASGREAFARMSAAVAREAPHNVLMGYAAYKVDELGAAPAEAQALILERAETLADIKAVAAMARQRGIAAGIEVGPYHPDDRCWTDEVLPLVTVPGIAFAMLPPNSGEPQDSTYHAPYPGGPGIQGFMRLYNHPRTIFAHDLNGLYLTK